MVSWEINMIKKFKNWLSEKKLARRQKRIEKYVKEFNETGEVIISNSDGIYLIRRKQDADGYTVKGGFIVADNLEYDEFQRTFWSIWEAVERFI